MVQAFVVAYEGVFAGLAAAQLFASAQIHSETPPIATHGKPSDAEPNRNLVTQIARAYLRLIYTSLFS